MENNNNNINDWLGTAAHIHIPIAYGCMGAAYDWIAMMMTTTYSNHDLIFQTSRRFRLLWWRGTKKTISAGVDYPPESRHSYRHNIQKSFLSLINNIYTHTHTHSIYIAPATAILEQVINELLFSSILEHFPGNLGTQQPS